MGGDYTGYEILRGVGTTGDHLGGWLPQSLRGRPQKVNPRSQKASGLGHLVSGRRDLHFGIAHMAEAQLIVQLTGVGHLLKIKFYSISYFLFQNRYNTFQKDF